MTLSSWVKKKCHPQIPSIRATLAPSLRLREGQKELGKTEFDSHGINERNDGCYLCKKVAVKLNVKMSNVELIN